MADSFSDLLQQFLPKLQGDLQQQAAASPLNPANITSPATALPAATALSLGPAAVMPLLASIPSQIASEAAGHLAQIPAGSLFGPLLAPPGNAPPIASSSPQAAAGYQVGRALGALFAGQGLPGVADVFGQGQQAWHQPEPIMGYKGVLEAPFNPLTYLGTPQGKAAGALADAGVPGAAALESANALLARGASGAARGLETGVGNLVSKLPFGLGEESVGSQKVAEAARLGNLRSSMGNLADQGVAPPEARGNLFGWLADQQRAAQAATAGAAPAEGAATAAAPDFLAAVGIPRGVPLPAGTETQISKELFAPLVSQAHRDINIARTAYRNLGLDESQPLASVIAQADQVAPPLLDAIPQATEAWQAANPGKALVNDGQFNDLLRAAEQNIAQATGTFADEQTHWSTVLHWLQDTWPTFSPASQKPVDVEAIAVARLAAERGTAPLHPALAGEPGLGTVPPTPEPTALAPGAAPSPPAAAGGAPPAPEAGPPVPGAAPLPSGATPRAAPPFADFYDQILAEEPAEAMRLLQQNRAAQGPGPTVPEAVPPLMEGAAPEAVAAPGRPPVPEAGPPVVAPGAAPPPAGGALPRSTAPGDYLYHVIEGPEGWNGQALTPGGQGMRDVGGVWLNEGGPVGRLGQVLAIDKAALDPALLSRSANGFPVYQGAIPPEAILPLGQMERTGAGRLQFPTQQALEDAVAAGAPPGAAGGTAGGAPPLTGAPAVPPAVEPPPIPDVGLPRNLQGATPRYGYGGNNYTLDFSSDIDKAFYIVAQNAKRSKQDAAYLSYLQGIFPDLGETELRGIGQQVRGSIKTLAQQAEPDAGSLSLPRTFDQYLPSREAPPVPGVVSEPAPAPAAPEAPQATQFDAEGNLIRFEGRPVPPVPVGQPLPGEAPPAATVGEVPPAAAGAPTGSPAVGPSPAAPPPAPAAVPPGMSAAQAATLTPVQLAQVAGNDAAFFQRVMEDSPAYMDRFTKDKAAFQGVQNAIAAVLPAGTAPPATIADAQAALKGVAGGRALGAVETKKLQSTLDELAPRYPTDVNLLDPAVRDVAVGQSWLYDRGQEIARSSTAPGIPGWAKQPLAFWQWAMNGLRSFELFSGMQPAKHVADAYLHQLGFAGEAGIADMGPTLWQAVTTGAEPGVGNTAAAWYASHGLSRPAEIARTAYGADIGAAGASLAPAVSMDTPLVGGLIRGGTAVKNRFDALARGADTAVREGGYQTGVDQSLAEQAPAFASKLTDLLGDAGTTIGQQFQDAQGVMTPGALKDAMVAADVAPDAMKEALLALGDVQAQANTAGLALADKMAPGAVRITNLDEALRYAIPFSTFASRQIPRTLELFLSNPAIWNAFRGYHEITDAADKAEGRLPGTSLAQNVLVFKIGATRVFINPLEYLAEDRPFRVPFTSPKQAPILGDLYNRLSQQGFGPAGPIGLGITGSGLLGPAPPPELSPVDSLLSNAASWASAQQVTMPWAAAINQRAGGKPLFAPPESIGAGVEGFDPNLEVRKRLGEMSIEETGRVNNPLYEAAAHNPADPLYQRAVREVNGRELLQEALHLLAIGVKLSPESAGLISRGMAGIPQVNAAGGQPGQWTMPTLPYANAGANPLVTFADRERMLMERARTQPAAIGYRMAYGGETAAGPPSEYSQFVDNVKKQWATGSVADRSAILADPRKSGIILAEQIKTSPLYRPPGGMGGSRPFSVQDVLPVGPP